MSDIQFEAVSHNDQRQVTGDPLSGGPADTYAVSLTHKQANWPVSCHSSHHQLLMLDMTAITTCLSSVFLCVGTRPYGRREFINHKPQLIKEELNLVQFVPLQLQPLHILSQKLFGLAHQL